MALATTYVMHTHKSNVTPANDFSGTGVWNATELVGTGATHANEHYAYDGLVVTPPEGFNSLKSSIAVIQGSPYKCAMLYVSPLESDEAQNFKTALSGMVGKAVQLSFIGWGNDELGVITPYHSILYWAVVMDPAAFSFAVFAAGAARVQPGNVMAPPEYIDCGATNSKTVEVASGRLAEMTNTAFLPPGLAMTPQDPMVLNPAFPEITA